MTGAHTQKVCRVDFLQEVRVEAPALYGQIVQLALLIALAQNVFFDRALADQAVDVHLARLPNAVAPVLRLRSP